ncbi:MAG: DeoR/GlpR family DNA-binding transcription regulator [Bacteroidota bacterium]
MKLLLDDRKLSILELIAGNESVSVKELSRLLKVSEATIRTDLSVLEKNGKIVRYHGGARLIENRYKQEFTYQTRKNLNFQQKKEIGEVAANMVEPNDSILLDASTTSLAMAQALRNKENLRDITVIPLGIWTAIEFLGYDNYNILLPGGYLRHASASLTGLPTNDFFDGLIVQKAFMGAWGISVEQGFTDSHLVEVELKKTILKKAKEVIIMVDGSKFNQSGLASYASIDKISQIITDKTAPVDEIEKIRKLGVKVVVAN